MVSEGCYQVGREQELVNSREFGFTLLELSIVLIITSFLFIPLVRAYEVYQIKERVVDTRESVKLASGVVSSYYGGTTSYPCPADASLPRTDPLYGVAQCSSTSLFNPNASLVNAGDCTPGGGLCLLAGERGDLNGDGVVDRVLIGAVPSTTIKQILGGRVSFSEDDLVDPWGNRIMYAVSESLTDTATYRFYNGVISAVDEFGNDTAGVNSDAHYAVFSTGRDQRGGFDDRGNLSFPCNVDANSEDFENCDNADSIFVQAKGYNLSTVGGRYYDDDIYFGKDLNEAIWKYESDMSNVYTTVSGNVGIGTDNPTEKLTIENGAGVAELSVDNSVFVEQICDENGLNCFRLDSITGAGAIQCPTPGDVMIGISNGLADCVTPTFSAPTPSQACGTGQYVNGFRTDGSVICTP